MAEGGRYFQGDGREWCVSRASGAVEFGAEDGLNASPFEGRRPWGVEPRDTGACACDRGIAPCIYREWFCGAEALRRLASGARAGPRAGEAWGNDDEAGVSRGAARKKGVRGGVAEAEEVAGMRSEATGRQYPRTMICAVYRLPRSTWYSRGGVSVTERSQTLQ